MTLIAAVGFPDEVIVLSDSRASFPNGLPPRDELKKIYQLSQYSCILYTSADVRLTWKIIEETTKFVQTINHDDTGEFLKEVCKFVNSTYDRLTINRTKKPEILFIYAGVDNKPLKIPSKKYDRMKKMFESRPFTSKKILEAKEVGSYKIIRPPTPILIKQHFPEGRVSATRDWDMCAEGTGSKFVEELESFYSRLFFFPTAFNKAVILKDMCDKYIQDSKIVSIGGLVQTFIINENGVHPLMFSMKSAGIEEEKYYIDESGDWIKEKADGTKEKVKQNPF